MSKQLNNINNLMGFKRRFLHFMINCHLLMKKIPNYVTPLVATLVCGNIKRSRCLITDNAISA